VHTVLIVVIDTATPAITAALAEITDKRRLGAAPTSYPATYLPSYPASYATIDPTSYAASDPASYAMSDPASDPASYAARTDVRVLARRVTVDARAHGERLAPAIDALLREAGARPRDLAAVAAGVGPGPFTGLRVGLVTAAVLADGLGIPAYGVGTLDALGWGTTGRVLVATDARRKEIYWGVYADGVPVSGPSVDKPESVTVDVDRAVGDGARRYADVLGMPIDEPWYPPVEALAALAAGRVRDKAPTEPLTPLYLRRPDAVEPGGVRKTVLP
jgi:tRNA threonylcarbamoyl adenosine modification protein YeaZ